MDMVDTNSLYDIYSDEICLDGDEGEANRIDQGRIHQGDITYAHRVLDHVRT